MKKAARIIYIVLFMMIISMPLLLMGIAPNNTNIEKKELAKWPSLTKDGHFNMEYSSEIEAWFNDHLPLRAGLISVHNAVIGEFFHADTSNVIVGKDGWLFYANEAEDYMNTNAMSDRQVADVAVTLSLIEEAVHARGGNFLFVPAPNKASVYDDHFPVRYLAAEENNLSRICDKLEEYGVNYVDLRAVLRENRDMGLYHRRDSHWNYQGANLVYYKIMDGIGREHKDYANASYTVVKDWRGDLDKLLYPAGGVMDDQYYYDISFSPFMFTYPASAVNPEEALANFMSDKEDGDIQFTAKNKELKDGSNLYMVRDSFGRALLPYMIDNYETSSFKRTDRPDIESQPEDTDVIYEIVERNLYNLINTAPFVYAPVRDNIDTTTYEQGEALTMDYKQEVYGLHIYGTLPETDLNSDGRVYLALTTSDTTTTYEAFPIYEKLLLKAPSENAFSAYIPMDSLTAGTFEITVLEGNTAYTAGEVTVQ